MPAKIMQTKYHISRSCDICDKYTDCRKYYARMNTTFICKKCNNLRYAWGERCFQEYLMEKKGIIYDVHSDYPDESQLKLQSTPIIDASTDSQSIHTEQETVEFIDETQAMDQGYGVYSDPMSNRDLVSSADLDTFLRRPVRIASFTWLESDNTDTILASIRPWQLFFSDTRIKYKLNNFAYIRANLHVKVMINASPFYYGCLGMSYSPLTALTPSTIGTPTNRLIPESQHPISYLYPQSNMGAEMTLPFFLHKNWLDVNTETDFTDMGVLNFISFTILRSANGISGTGVTVQVYAWAEDVELSGSTLALALQSKPMPDEYGNGPISGPSSTIAKMANLAKNIPYIGKFATATEIGAKAISGIATLFGFTNVPVIDNVMPYQNRAFQSLATTEIGFPNEKLTLLAKNELTVDPSVVGAPSEDPLAIENLVKRESYITKTTWSTTSAVDTILFYSRVHPYQFEQLSDAPGASINLTPMAMTSALFLGWRGDIIFRFKVIASPYHKGRLIVAFDPQGSAFQNVVNQALVTSAIYTKIIDIGEEDDVELRVPYNQAVPFLRMQASTTVANVPFSTSTSPTWNVQEGRDNGAITVRVLTTLTAPVITAPVSVLVYVRGAENLEFGNPRRPPQDVSIFQLQSKPISDEMQDEKVFSKKGDAIETMQYRVNYGEVVRSLRTLLHRSNHTYSQRTITALTTGRATITSRFGKLPFYYGYDPNGIHSAASTIGVGNKPFNYSKTLPIHWILPCFVGYRGSGVWTFNVDSPEEVRSVKVVREPVDYMTWIDTISAIPIPTNTSSAARQSVTGTQSTVGGAALTTQLTQAGLSVLCPNYNLYKFNSTYPRRTTFASELDGSSDDAFFLEVSQQNVTNVNNTIIEKYWNAGPDFQPLFFLNVPTLYNLPTVPPSA